MQKVSEVTFYSSVLNIYSIIFKSSENSARTDKGSVRQVGLRCIKNKKHSSAIKAPLGSHPSLSSGGADAGISETVMIGMNYKIFTISLIQSWISV